jgi:hypothetical protein
MESDLLERIRERVERLSFVTSIPYQHDRLMTGAQISTSLNKAGRTLAASPTSRTAMLGVCNSRSATVGWDDSFGDDPSGGSMLGEWRARMSCWDGKSLMSSEMRNRPRWRESGKAASSWIRRTYDSNLSRLNRVTSR